MVKIEDSSLQSDENVQNCDKKLKKKMKNKDEMPVKTEEVTEKLDSLESKTSVEDAMSAVKTELSSLLEDFPVETKKKKRKKSKSLSFKQETTDSSSSIKAEINDLSNTLPKNISVSEIKNELNGLLDSFNDSRNNLSLKGQKKENKLQESTSEEAPVKKKKKKKKQQKNEETVEIKKKHKKKKHKDDSIKDELNELLDDFNVSQQNRLNGLEGNMHVGEAKKVPKKKKKKKRKNEEEPSNKENEHYLNTRKNKKKKKKFSSDDEESTIKPNFHEKKEKKRGLEFNEQEEAASSESSINNIDPSSSEYKKGKRSLELNQQEKTTLSETPSLKKKKRKLHKDEDFHETMNDAAGDVYENLNTTGKLLMALRKELESVDTKKNNEKLEKKPVIKLSTDEVFTSSDDEEPDIKKEFRDSSSSFIKKEFLPNDSMELTDVDLEKLKRLRITVPFEVPVLHTLQTRSTCLSKKQLNYIRQLKCPYKTGPYTAKEDEVIKKNWKYFCELHDLEDNPLLLRKLKSVIKRSEGIKFCQFLGQNLPDRLLSGIYMRFRRLHSQMFLNNGRFTPDEDNLIIDFMETSTLSQPFCVLAKMLGRDRIAVFKHYKLLMQSRKDKEVVRWTETMQNKLVDCILEVTKNNKLNNLIDRTITTKEWNLIAKKMNLQVLKVRQVWENKLYTKLFAKEDREILQEKLVKKLINDEVYDWRALNWDDIAKEFPGVAAKSLYHILKKMIRKYVPEKKRDDLKASLLCLGQCNFKTTPIKKESNEGSSYKEK